MYKTILFLYIICFALYVLFTRQPDYQDGEFTTGIIEYAKDSTQTPVAKAVFSVNNSKDTVTAVYPFRRLQQGEQVKIIYDTSDPSKAAVYTCWGYWLKWDEILASVLIPIIFLYAAKAITGRPTPEALIEELEEQKNESKK